MARLAAGTPHSNPRRAGSYTAEQDAALEKLKVPDRSPGVARAKHANAALAPDGTLIPNAGSQLITAARARASAALKGDQKDPAVLRAAAAAAADVQSVVDHVAEQRFLFVVDRDFTPVVYFQCATAQNPDLPSA